MVSLEKDSSVRSNSREKSASDRQLAIHLAAKSLSPKEFLGWYLVTFLREKSLQKLDGDSKGW